MVVSALHFVAFLVKYGNDRVLPLLLLIFSLTPDEGDKQCRAKLHRCTVHLYIIAMQIHTPKQRQKHTRNLDITQLLCYIGFGIGSEYQFAPENLVSRDGFGSPVPRQPAHLHTQAKSDTYLRDYSRFPRRRSFIYLISDIILLTQCYFPCETRLNVMKRFCICSL